MSPSEAPAAAGGGLSWGSGKHSSLVWQSEQLSLTQLGPVLQISSASTYGRVGPDAGGPRAPFSASGSRERERERVPGFTSEKEELPARMKAPETTA